MDIWKDLGISGNNASEHKCYEKAFLIVQSDSGLLKKKFNYENVNNETYTETASNMPMEYTTKSKTIYTPFYWLPFCRGARVQFENGEEMTIKDFVVEQDSTKAISGGSSSKGLTITF